MGDNQSEDHSGSSPIFSLSRSQQTGAIFLIAVLIALILYRSC